MVMPEPVERKKSPGLWPGVLCPHLLFSEDTARLAESELSPERVSAIALVENEVSFIHQLQG